MQAYFIDFMLVFGAVLAAVAVGGVCVVGLVVWLGGRDERVPK